jgi:hypothetical protein
MNNLGLTPTDTVHGALTSATWAHALPPTAGGYAPVWRDAMLGEVPAWGALAHALGLAAARTPEPFEGAHEVWGAACVGLLLRDAQRPLAASPEAHAALLREAAGALRGALREAPAPRAPALDRAFRAARKALLLHRRGTASLGHGFELALCDRLSDALGALSRAETDPPRELLAAVDKAAVAAQRNHERDWLQASPALRQARARAAVTEVAACWAQAAAALPADGAASALWLARVALRLLAAVPTLDRWTAGQDPATTMATTTTMTTQNPGADTAPGAAPAAAGEETTMTDTTPRTWTRTLQVDATDAAWRTAGSQFVKLARDPLAGLLCRHLGPDDPSLRARVAAFLETDLGASLLAAVLSAGLGALPTGAAGEVPQRLARELRVRAMAGTADVVADVLMGPLREVMATFLRDGAPLLATPLSATLEEPQARLSVSHLNASAREPSER